MALRPPRHYKARVNSVAMEGATQWPQHYEACVGFAMMAGGNAMNINVANGTIDHDVTTQDVAHRDPTTRSIVDQNGIAHGVVNRNSTARGVANCPRALK